jgi:hypothetical protein
MRQYAAFPKMSALTTLPYETMPAEPDYPPSDERLTELWKKEVLSDPTSDPTRPSLSAYVDAGHPFSVPWASDAREVLTGFISTRIADTSGPWLSSCAFDLAQARLTAVLPDLRGGIASFRDGHSTHSSSTGEHLSAELGVSVGYPFLSASVSGKYDRNVIEDENVSRGSIQPYCGCATYCSSPYPGHFSKPQLPHGR